MTNKAFYIDARARTKGAQYHNIDIDLQNAGTHPAVMREITNNRDRRDFGKSEIEVTGEDWRRLHGFGRPFSCGNGIRDQMRKQRRRLDKRRNQTKSRLVTKVFTVAQRTFSYFRRIASPASFRRRS